MDSFSLKLNEHAFLALMKDFYELSNMKIAMFDTAGNEILSFPEEHCPFCRLVRSNKKGEQCCRESNAKSFQRCKKSGRLEIFHCHAGLLETTAPLIDNNTVIGYIMIGQITDCSDSNTVTQLLSDALKKLGMQLPDSNDSPFHITYKSNTQIKAAAQILEACTFYVLLKNMVSLQRKTFIQNLNTFLMDHLSEDLSVSRLTSELHISKSKLYESCSRYLSVGIAEHIKALRMKEAKRLLKETALPVHVISDKVGFSDYNYFCRVFKKEVGLSAGKYRQKSK